MLDRLHKDAPLPTMKQLDFLAEMKERAPESLFRAAQETVAAAQNVLGYARAEKRELTLQHQAMIRALTGETEPSYTPEQELRIARVLRTFAHRYAALCGRAFWCMVCGSAIDDPDTDHSCVDAALPVPDLSRSVVL